MQTIELLEENLDLLFGEGSDEKFLDSWSLEGPKRGKKKEQMDERLHKEWMAVVEKIDMNQMDTIKPTRVIDFQFLDYSNLKFKSPNGLLERAWFFNVSGTEDANVRFVLHGHTFVKWSERLGMEARERSSRLSQVNVRLAIRGEHGWQQDPSGFSMIPINQSLKNWRTYFSDMTTWRNVLWEWQPGIGGRLPDYEDKSDESMLLYQRIQRLIEKADRELVQQNACVSAYNLPDMKAKIRGSGEPVDTFEVVFTTPTEGRAMQMLEPVSDRAFSFPVDISLKTIQHDEARSFWVQNFSSNNNRVKWTLFEVALQEDYGDLFGVGETARLDLLRAKLDHDSTGFVDIAAFNIVTRKQGLRRTLEC